MSKYATIDTQFKKDPAGLKLGTGTECLLEALRQAGYKNVEHHQTPQHLYGFEGRERPETAEIIVRRKEIGGASNDIGFKLNDKGVYEAIISAYDSRKHNLKWLKGVEIGYQEGVAQSFAKSKGLRFLGRKVEKGKIKYQYQALA